MKIRTLVAGGMIAAASAMSSNAGAVAVSGISVFDSTPAGILGNWSHSFTLGAPGIQILQIEIILNANLFFDTAPAAPGFVVDQDVSTTAVGGTGFTGFSATGAALDGGTSVKLSFSDFQVGETYTHVGDVDEVQVLQPLQNCAGLGVAAAIACAANNATITANNALLIADGSLVNGAEFAGSTVKVTLSTGAGPVTLTGIFTQTGDNAATAIWTGDVQVPLPSTLLLAAGALAGFGWVRRRAS